MYAAAELGRNPASKHQIQPEYGDEKADAGRDCRTHLARPKFLARTGQGNIIFPCSADHEQDWPPYPVDPYSCYVCYNDHTCMHASREPHAVIFFYSLNNIAVYFLYAEYVVPGVYVFLPKGVFPPCDYRLDFDISSLCGNSTN